MKVAPFSASAVTEAIRPDGAQVTAPILGHVYRDREGRTLLERITLLPGAQAERSTSIYIYDAVGNLFYTLIPRSQIAIKLTRGASSRSAMAMIAGRDEGSKQESLGKQIIEGVAAEGTRTVRTIPPRAMGNNCPIDIISEQWSSPELQVVILAKWIDPLSGVETVYRLTNINRSEPDPSLFQVPPNYTIRERWSFCSSG